MLHSVCVSRYKINIETILFSYTHFVLLLLEVARMAPGFVIILRNFFSDFKHKEEILNLCVFFFIRGNKLLCGRATVYQALG